MRTGLNKDIEHLLENTKLTSAEIIDKLGITYGKFYDSVSRTYVEARDTQIAVYDKVGHNGDSKEDKCIMCGIIMLRDYSDIPDGWGGFQQCCGHMCRGCVDDMIFMCPEPWIALSTAGCAYCGREADMYFFTDGDGPRPDNAVVLCKEHRSRFDETEKDIILRDFYNRVDTDRLFAITDWRDGEEQPRMPLWDDLEQEEEE